MNSAFCNYEIKNGQILIRCIWRREYDDVITTTTCSVGWVKNTLYIQYVVYREKPRLFSGEYHVRITKKKSTYIVVNNFSDTIYCINPYFCHIRVRREYRDWTSHNI